MWYLGSGHTLEGLVPLSLSLFLKLLRGLQLGSGFTLNIPKDKERRKEQVIEARSAITHAQYTTTQKMLPRRGWRKPHSTWDTSLSRRALASSDCSACTVSPPPAGDGGVGGREEEEGVAEVTVGVEVVLISSPPFHRFTFSLGWRLLPPTMGVTGEDRRGCDFYKRKSKR